MVSHIVTLRNMESVEDGKVQIWLHDNEMDHDIAVKLSSEEMPQLGAFPGVESKDFLGQGLAHRNLNSRRAPDA